MPHHLPRRVRGALIPPPTPRRAARPWLLGAVCALAGCQPVAVSGLDDPADEVVALTYNVHGLPPEITGDDTTARMLAIAPLLRDFTLVALQEDFLDANHHILEDANTHRTKLRFDDVLDDRIYGPGLALLADFVSLGHTHEHFDACYGVLDHGSDCAASKGFQRLRLDLDRVCSLDVYNTHLDAGGSDEDQAARESQVDQLLTAFGEQSYGEPLVLMGDLNLGSDDPDEAPLLERLIDEGGLTDACAAVGCDEPHHIERVLYRSGYGVELWAERWALEPAFVDADGEPLSDHPAVSVVLRWAPS